MLSRIQSVIDPAKIKYIISNHSEMDHSGCLPAVIDKIKPEKIFASHMGMHALQAHFHFENEITDIHDGQKIQLGDANFTFLETRMLHWPDSMFTYFENDGILFSQDGFGMHLATDKPFVDQNDQAAIKHETKKYYANILQPFSNLVSRIIDMLPTMQFNISMIAPDHGPIWRKKEDIDWIITNWKNWAKSDYFQKVIIIYDTMWESTAQMAHAIAEGVTAANIPVKIMPLSKSHRSDIATEILEAGALLVGTPTINQQMFPTLADVLSYLKGLKPQKLIGQVFGSYGWSASGTKLAQQILQDMKVNLLDEAIEIRYVPTEDDLKQCFELGQHIAKELKNRS